VKLARLIVEYRPHTNAAILQSTGHTNRRSHTRGGGVKKEAKKINIVDILSIQE
jgi:hypothetical protein